MTDVWNIENECYETGYTVVCGCDEAGAGSLAGPVYAAAVVLPRGVIIDGLTDSKKLSGKKREELYDIIINTALDYAVSSVDEKTIDEINILNARLLAMDAAIKKLSVAPDFALIDGNRSTGISVMNRCVVHGDSLCVSISAASVLAKVSRDRFMLEMAELYPEYGFDRHKGYGTKLHYERLRMYGPSAIHRKTFLRKQH